MRDEPETLRWGSAAPRPRASSVGCPGSASRLSAGQGEVPRAASSAGGDAVLLGLGRRGRVAGAAVLRARSRARTGTSRGSWPRRTRPRSGRRRTRRGDLRQRRVRRAARCRPRARRASRRRAPSPARPRRASVTGPAMPSTARPWLRWKLPHGAARSAGRRCRRPGCRARSAARRRSSRRCGRRSSPCRRSARAAPPAANVSVAAATIAPVRRRRSRRRALRASARRARERRLDSSHGTWFDRSSLGTAVKPPGSWRLRG